MTKTKDCEQKGAKRRGRVASRGLRRREEGGKQTEEK